jgi:hypothetical protein
MVFRGDERGQPVQIGFILLFGILVLAFSSYQAFVVPQQNAEVEFTHSQTVQDQFDELRNGISNAASNGNDQSVGISLGTRYPSRLIALNPPPAEGSLRTTNPGELEVQGLSDDETDLCAPSASAVETRAVQYQPNYNEYQSLESITYENTFTARTFQNGERYSSQSLVQTAGGGGYNEIDLQVLTGSVSESGASLATVDLNPSRRYTQEYDSVQPTLIVPSRVSPAMWEDEILAEQSGLVNDVTWNNASASRVQIEFASGDYAISCAAVGLNSEPAYQPPPTASGGAGGTRTGAYALNWNRTGIEAEQGIRNCFSGNDTCVYDLSDDDGILNLTAFTDPAMAFVTVDFGTNNSSVVSGFNPRENETNSTGETGTDATISTTGVATLLAGSTEDSTTITLEVIRILAGFPRLAYTDGGTLRGIDADGVRENYDPGAGNVVALGPANSDISGDGNEDAPFADGNGNLVITNDEGRSETLDSSGNLDGTRMGVGDWNDTNSSTVPEVVYVQNGELYAATPAGTNQLCQRLNAVGRCIGGGYPAQTVAGVADYNDSGSTDIVYVDDNNALVYVDEEGEAPVDTGYTVNSSNALSTPADFDGDGNLEVAAVNNNDNIDLIQSDGSVETYTTAYQVRAVPMGAIDWTGDGTPDIMHVNGGNGTAYRYNVVNGDTKQILDDQGNTVKPGPSGIT